MPSSVRKQAVNTFLGSGRWWAENNGTPDEKTLWFISCVSQILDTVFGVGGGDNKIPVYFSLGNREAYNEWVGNLQPRS